VDGASVPDEPAAGVDAWPQAGGGITDTPELQAAARRARVPDREDTPGATEPEAAPEPDVGDGPAPSRRPEPTESGPGTTVDLERRDVPVTEAGDDDVPPPGPERGWPVDPRTEAPLTERDLDFLGWRPEHWSRGEAPLGMTPETYAEWRGGLRNALRQEGVDADTVDVRLAGSASEGFSGPHKPAWRASDDRIAGDPDAQARLAEWLGDDPERLGSRPFDSGYRLGVDKPSDYDVNISSDDLVARARDAWEGAGAEGEFVEGSHEYVNKETAEAAFPHLASWAREWSARLAPAEGTEREVSWAVFPSSGPKDVSETGFFVHFRDDQDWIINRRTEGA
jgi:hypothetical protein